MRTSVSPIRTRAGITPQPYVSSGRFYQGPGTYVPLTIPIGNFIQEMMLTGNVSGFTSSMDGAFKRLAIRTSA